MSILTKRCDRGLDCNITDATELPNGSAADGSHNVLYSKGTCATPYGFGKLGDVLDSAVLLKGGYTELDKTQHLIAITKDKIYDRNFVAAAWAEKTKGYGVGPGTPVSLGGNINNPMSMASILHTDGLAIDNLAGDDIGYQHLIVCPGSSAAQATAEAAPIQRWAGKNEYDFTDLLGADGYHDVASSKTKHFATQVGSFYNRLLLINPKEYDADSVLHENNQRVRWPMAGKLETGTAWSGTGSGFYDLLDTGGYNVRGELLGMQWIQYQNNSIWSLTHVGGTRVFEPNIEIPNLGIFGAHCIYAKNNQHFFLGNDLNVYAYSGGSNIIKIGEKIQKYLQRDLDPAYANQCWMCMGAGGSRLWLFIVPKNSLYATQAYGMDMRTGVWMKRDYTHKWPTGGITSVALLAAGGYHAGETYRLYQNYNAGDDGAHPVVSGASWLSQTFTTGAVGDTPPGSHNSTSVRLKLYKGVGTTPGVVTVSLRATSSNLPTGADLCVGTINGDDFTESTDGQWYRITFTSNPVLAASTKYAIIIRSTAASIGWRWDSSSPSYANGNNGFSIDSGATWPANKTGNITAIADNVTTGSITAFAPKTGSISAFVPTSGVCGQFTPLSGSITSIARTSGSTTKYEYDAQQPTKTKVTSAGHALTDGQSIVISGTTNYNGTYTISSVYTDVFYIVKTYVANDATGIWTKSGETTGYSIITGRVNNWPSTGGSVVISGTTNYNGTYTVYGATGSTFRINKAWTASETGTWTLSGYTTGRLLVSSGDHGMSTGQSIVISGSAYYNGTYTIERATGYPSFCIVKTWAGQDYNAVWTRSGETAGQLIVTSTGHGLSDGQDIIITSSTDYDGTYAISGAVTNSFRITKTWTQTRTGNWTISGVGTITVTSANHGLSDGAQVTISGTTHYNSPFTIFGKTANDFKITVTWAGDDATGTWTGASTGYVVVTSAGHTLSYGDTVVVTTSGATDYDGTYVIANVTANTFNILKAFTQTRTGTWSGGKELVAIADFMFEEYGSAIGSDVMVLTGETLTLGDSAGQVYQYDETLSKDDGVDIPARQITEIYDLELPSKNKIWPSITVTAKGTGLIVSYRTGNFQTVNDGWVAFAEQVLTSEFADYTFFINDTSRKVQFRFSNTDSDEFEISNYSLEKPAVMGEA